ncbi:MAG: LacI family DNA-binding transcriptional regulator [Halanaerobiales bacterium]|nr:LacI family DNA-binding transcriptional regulator [Halanaerobiales bacterium]
MKATIKDVAKKAGVSIATVSRVLNNQLGYAKDTELKVLQAIKDLEYHPNALARGLVGKKTRTIGVLIPQISSLVASKILAGIEDTAHNLNQSVIICNTDNDGKRILNYLSVLQEKQIDGLIVVSQMLIPKYVKKIKEMKVPVMLVATKDQQNCFPFIKVDDEIAAYHATQHLIQARHKKIGMISGSKEDIIAGIFRVRGYKQALKDNGLNFDDRYLVYGDFTFNSGKACMKQLLHQAPEITAVFAASDEMAVGALSVANQQRIRVPDDLSVIGYDNTQLAEMAIPPLTTLSQPLYQMGAIGADYLISMSEGKSVKSKIMDFEIILRNTTKILETSK